MGNEKKVDKGVETLNKSNTILLIIKFVLPVVVALLIFFGIKYVASNYKMNVINLDKYEALVAGNKQSLVFVISDECVTCERTERLLKKMLQGSNIKTYEINIDSLNDDDKTRYMNIFDETKEGVTAPALLLVKDGNLLSYFYGPFDEDLIIEFLQNNGLVKRVTNG